MYLRTDEEAEAADAICMASRLSDGLERDIRLWRWVVIALHNAVQGFMVLSLRHGSGLAALSDKSSTEYMEALDTCGPYPQEKLDSYLNLYRKVKSKKHGEIGGNTRFVPSSTEGKNIKRLDTIRNALIHFTPKGWSLDVDGLPQICLDSSRIIAFLGWETENTVWNHPNYREQAQLCCAKFKTQMGHLKRLYENIRS